MSTRKRLDTILTDQFFSNQNPVTAEPIYSYAGGISFIEKCVVVVSDLKSGTSRIFDGAFSDVLGLTGYSTENSIWEEEILNRMTPDECEEKYHAELRFYNFLRHIPRHRRSDYYLATNLRVMDNQGMPVDVLHRLYYLYDNDSDVIRFGVCLYSPLTFSLPAKSVAVNSITGKWVELSSVSDCRILSTREKQVLVLIERGMTSRSIATELCISTNTVNRHRQEILAKLHVKNSTEACRIARQLNIIG